MNFEFMELFGLNFQTEKFEANSLPLYMTAGRIFCKLSCSGKSFILIRTNPDERFGVIAFAKQAARTSEEYGMPVAFSFENISRSQRNSLIERNIPFISDSGQLYLPFLGMMLSDRFVHLKKTRAEKMMPVTQSLFLFMLYQCKGKPVLKKNAAEAIGVTRTSLTRASEQLSAMNLITQEKRGKEYCMTACGSGLELYEKAKPFLINPVQRIITVQNDRIYDQYPFSGESALAERTMLNNPGIPVRAVWKTSFDTDAIQEIDIRWEPDADAAKLELWKYDPSLFAKDGTADPVSLALSFENNADERIEGAIEEYMEEYTW